MSLGRHHGDLLYQTGARVIPTVHRFTGVHAMCRRFGLILLAFCSSLGMVADHARAQDQGAYDRKVDVVYGRKFGMALTMDVFTPKANANGAAVVWVVSGGWFSSHEAINSGFIGELLKRGYTVFAVVHGSQPRFTIPEI